MGGIQGRGCMYPRNANSAHGCGTRRNMKELERCKTARRQQQNNQNKGTKPQPLSFIPMNVFLDYLCKKTDIWKEIEII